MFEQYNGRLVDNCQYIREYAHNCNGLMSIIVPFYIFVQCYMIYIVTLTELPIEQSLIFCVATVECNFFLFAITHECAYIVKLNNALEKENRVFAYYFYNRGGYLYVEGINILKVWI